MTLKKQSSDKHQASELKQLKSKLDEEKHRHQRLAADYANLERRVIEERGTIRQEAGHQLLEKLFPVMDNLYRASMHAPAVAIDETTKTLPEADLQKIH